MADPITPVVNKIKPPDKGLYLGAFAPDPKSGDTEITTKKSVDSFAALSGTEVDIALKFMTFATGLNFPVDEAKVMTDRGGTLLIRLEPMTRQEVTDQSFSLKDIIAGKHDGLLINFANGAKAFGQPVFVSFGHEMNSTSYPWGNNPEEYIKAYQHVHAVIGQIAPNVTWVWNPNVGQGSVNGYYPGDEYVDWVAADGYNSEDWVPWQSCSDLFSEIIKEFGPYKKPVMIGEFGTDANTRKDEKERKPAWLSECVAYFAEGGCVKAFIYFNKDKYEDGEKKEWAIDTPEAKSAFNAAIKKYEQMFVSQIKIGDYVPDAETCAAVTTGAYIFKEQSVRKYFQSIKKNMPADKGTNDSIKKRRIELKIARMEIERHWRWPSYPLPEELAYSEILIRKWLGERSLGKAAKDPLGEIVSLSITDFWKALLATIFVQDKEGSLAEKYLKKLGIKTTYVKDSEENKLQLFKEIYEGFILPSKDPKFAAENLTERAILAREIGRKEDAIQYVKDAEKLIRTLRSAAVLLPAELRAALIKDGKALLLFNNHSDEYYIFKPDAGDNDAVRNDPELLRFWEEFVSAGPIRASIDRRMSKASWGIRQNQYQYYAAKARIYEIKLTFLAVEMEKAPPEKAIEKFSYTYQLAQEASLELNGFELIEARFLGAQSLIRRAGIKKDLGNSCETAEKVSKNEMLEGFVAAHNDKFRYDNAAKVLIVKGKMRKEDKLELLEIYSSPEEKEAINRLFQQSDYSNDLTDANKLLEYVVKWGDEYNDKLVKEKNEHQEKKDRVPHPWMKILSDQAELWLRKIPVPELNMIRENLWQ